MAKLSGVAAVRGLITGNLDNLGAAAFETIGQYAQPFFDRCRLALLAGVTAEPLPSFSENLRRAGLDVPDEDVALIWRALVASIASDVHPAG